MEKILLLLQPDIGFSRISANCTTLCKQLGGKESSNLNTLENHEKT